MSVRSAVTLENIARENIARATTLAVTKDTATAASKDRQSHFHFVRRRRLSRNEAISLRGADDASPYNFPITKLNQPG
jgi:hypothetical protein